MRIYATNLWLFEFELVKYLSNKYVPCENREYSDKNYLLQTVHLKDSCCSNEIKLYKSGHLGTLN